ncbi:MAG: 2-dehydropantoate 2-reductase [Betaproteobacteria bacterium]
MKACIVGAGAIGAFIGARLAAAAQCEVSAVARGATLDALRRHGWRLQDGERLLQAPAQAVDAPEALGPQDLVVIAVKGPSMPQVARSIAPLLAPRTIVMPAMNGVPWWFVQGIEGIGESPLESVDPGGVVSRAIAREHVLGCVVHASASRVEPGLVRVHQGRRLIVGEPDGGASERVERVARLLEDAGFEVERSAAIRRDIWYKLWGNMTVNPVSAITGATADRILADPDVREFCAAAMREAAAIGARIGCSIDETPEDRQRVTAKLGAFRTSMLQDAEAGRAIELDAIVGAVAELGRRANVAAPNVNALLGLTRLFARVRHLYPG